MIGYINGIVLEADVQKLLVTTASGLGYELHLCFIPKTAYQEGEEVAFYTHLQVREDAFELFAFRSAADKRVFLMLCTVSGIGAKMAMNILCETEIPALLTAILHEDERSLTKLPGVGKKTAGRMLLELKDRVANDVQMAQLIQIAPAEKATPSRATHNDAYDGLLALGYTVAELDVVFAQLGPELHDSDSASVIRKALAILRKG